jgi:hypothetical protein
MRKIYDWEGWLSKPRMILRRGVHYYCSQSTICTQARTAASKLGLRISIKDQGSYIIIEQREVACAAAG